MTYTIRRRWAAWLIIFGALFAGLHWCEEGPPWDAGMVKPALAGTALDQSRSIEQATFHLNHTTRWDCALWDQARGPFSNIYMGVRWSVSDTQTKPYQWAGHNYGDYPVTVKLYYRATDHSSAVWQIRQFVIPSHSDSTIFVEALGIHSQYYHPAIYVYKDGTYIFQMNLWLWPSSSVGGVLWLGSLTNCTPTSTAMQSRSQLVLAA